MAIMRQITDDIVQNLKPLIGAVNLIECFGLNGQYPYFVKEYVDIENELYHTIDGVALGLWPL
jgi:hypothetical protein